MQKMETIASNLPADDVAATLDPIEIVQAQFEASARALVPTSRNRLAKHLTSATGLTHKEALDCVDKYCDEKNLPVPAYLSREFAVGYLKVIAVLWVVGAIAVLLYGRNLHQQRITPYGLWCIGAIMCGLAILFWIKSLEVEAANKKADEAVSDRSRTGASRI